MDACSSSGDCPSWSQLPPTFLPLFCYPGSGTKSTTNAYQATALRKLTGQFPEVRGQAQDSDWFAQCFLGVPLSQREKAQRPGPWPRVPQRVAQEVGLEPEAPHNPHLTVLGFKAIPPLCRGNTTTSPNLTVTEHPFPQPRP